MGGAARYLGWSTQFVAKAHLERLGQGIKLCLLDEHRGGWELLEGGLRQAWVEGTSGGWGTLLAGRPAQTISRAELAVEMLEAQRARQKMEAVMESYFLGMSSWSLGRKTLPSLSWSKAAFCQTQLKAWGAKATSFFCADRYPRSQTRNLCENLTTNTNLPGEE